MDLELNSADPLHLIDLLPPPAAEGEDQGVGSEADFEIIKTKEYIGPESKPVKEDTKEDKPKKDSVEAVKIGDSQPVKTDEKKKSLLQKIFGKKDKKNN